MYCKITYKWSSDKRRSGDYVLGSRALNVGQTVSCEVHVPECGGFAPETFAAVLPSGDGKGWNIVRRTDRYDIEVNGKKVMVASALDDGDEVALLKLDGEKLVVFSFEVHHDDYDMRSGVVYGHNKKSYLTWIGSFAGIVAVCMAFFAMFKEDGTLGHEDIREYEESVCQIVVDSVFLVCNDGEKEIVLKSIGLEQVEKGTCFLTDEGLVVTARHCIEPWIEAGISSPVVDMAVEAETMNRQIKEEKYFLRSRCEIKYGDEELEFSSADFCMNRSRDMIINIGDYNNPRYFRTVSPVARRRDMELGDFAYLETEYKGTITLADAEEMKDAEAYSDVIILGYPGNDNDTDNRNMARGMFQRGGEDGCMQMSSSEIISGYSGGPVFMNMKGGVKAVGLVSKVDSRDDKATFWVVPASEVLELHGNGGKINDDSFIYRR